MATYQPDYPPSMSSQDPQATMNADMAAINEPHRSLTPEFQNERVPPVVPKKRRVELRVVKKWRKKQKPPSESTESEPPSARLDGNGGSQDQADRHQCQRGVGQGDGATTEENPEELVPFSPPLDRSQRIKALTQVHDDLLIRYASIEPQSEARLNSISEQFQTQLSSLQQHYDRLLPKPELLEAGIIEMKELRMESAKELVESNRRQENLLRHTRDFEHQVKLLSLQLEGLGEQLEGAEAERDQFRQEKYELESKELKLQASVDALKRALEESNRRLSIARTDIDRLRSDKHHLEDKIQLLETTMKGEKSAREELEKNVKCEKSVREELERQLRAVVAERDQLGLEKEQWCSEKGDLEVRMERMQKANDDRFRELQTNFNSLQIATPGTSSQRISTLQLDHAPPSQQQIRASTQASPIAENTQVQNVSTSGPPPSSASGPDTSTSPPRKRPRPDDSVNKPHEWTVTVCSDAELPPTVIDSVNKLVIKFKDFLRRQRGVSDWTVKKFPGCLLMVIEKKGRSSWAHGTDFACETCIRRHTPCVRVAGPDGERSLQLLPLPESLRDGLQPSDPSYWTTQESGAI